MTRFQELVAEGLEQGMSRMAAERRARDILYGDPPDEPPAAAPAPPVSAAPAAPVGFANLDEMWDQLCATPTRMPQKIAFLHPEKNIHA